LNNVRGLLAAVNTALDDTNNILHVAQQQIITLELQKRALEAALLNKEQLVVEDYRSMHIPVTQEATLRHAM
jgi:hypothetical protein